MYGYGNSFSGQPRGVVPAQSSNYYIPQSTAYYPMYNDPQGTRGIQQQSTPSLPIGALLQMFGQGGASSAGAGAASGASAGAASGSAAGSLTPGVSAVFSNPWTGLVATALAGATALSADSAAAGNGGNWEKWGGPVVNIPQKLAKGDIKGVMKDGATGPVGAIYNIASGEDVGQSIANSFGPIGQVGSLLAKGELPFSGGDSSENWIKALVGFGL